MGIGVIDRELWARRELLDVFRGEGPITIWAIAVSGLYLVCRGWKLTDASVRKPHTGRNLETEFFAQCGYSDRHIPFVRLAKGLGGGLGYGERASLATNLLKGFKFVPGAGL